MIRRKALLAVMLSLALLASPAAAQADFGLEPGSVTIAPTNRDGTPDALAGSHPYEMNIHFALNTASVGGESRTEGGIPRDAIVDLPPGLIGNPAAVPVCSRQDFDGTAPRCPVSTQIGVLHANTALGEVFGPIYNVAPPPGSAASLGFSAAGFIGLQYASLRSEAGYGVRVAATNLPIEVRSVTATIWGTPADSGHDPERGGEAGSRAGGFPSDAPLQPYLTLPASCQSPPEITVAVDSVLDSGVFVEESGKLLDSGGQPTSLGGCNAVPFSPEFATQPTSRSATNPSGLDFKLKLPNQGLLAPGNIAETEPKKTVVTLPQGVSINPSFAEGASVCAEDQYKAEQIETKPGAGCPEASKLGSVVARSPLIAEPIEGSVYLAAPYENEFGALAAIYLVARAPDRGVIVKQAGKVQFDQSTGQITTTFDHLPPVPYSSFELHFREGARAPLVTPAACGRYDTVAKFTPFSAAADSEAVTRTASFQIERGADGGACPSGGLPPFHPGLIAGSINNAAGAYSPFNLRLFRNDSEQEITHFSIKLPPGLTGKLAGIPFCSDAAIAAAEGREGKAHGGAEELASPSCPAASEIGHTLVGAGVGSSLAYAPGKVYLAGPYHGSQLSIAAITAAKVGPFDLGTVVVREALRINPETAEVFIDATDSDPIPHIIQGIPVHLRDIRVYADRPDFTLNPTSCAPTSTASTVLGSGTSFASEADDQPLTVTTRFQAADCASLGFAPKLALSLKGGIKRNAVPAFKAVLTYPKGSYANIKSAQVTLPKSVFLDNEHIETICTRPVFNEGAVPGEKCPAASVYGHAQAVTPLLDEPIEGPVFLRANGGERNLPDLVAALHSGKININLVGYIDSVHKKGSESSRIRNTFALVPDAPVSKFTLEMLGGRKGLLINSTNLCKSTNRALAAFTGQNGKRRNFEPVLKPQGCKGKGKKAKRPNPFARLGW